MPQQLESRTDHLLRTFVRCGHKPAFAQAVLDKLSDDEKEQLHSAITHQENTIRNLLDRVTNVVSEKSPMAGQPVDPATTD